MLKLNLIISYFWILCLKLSQFFISELFNKVSVHQKLFTPTNQMMRCSIRHKFKSEIAFFFGDVVVTILYKYFFKKKMYLSHFFKKKKCLS